MSKLLYNQNMMAALDLPFILTSTEEITIVWEIYQLLQRQVNLLTPEIMQYCEKEVIEKILRENNQCLSVILQKCLEETLTYLKEINKHFRLGVYLYKPSDIPEWEGLTILINMDFSTFEEKLLLWDELEKRITKIFDRIKNQYPQYLEQIQEANNLIATSIHKLQQ
jgi:hypothetical protein